MKVVFIHGDNIRKKFNIESKHFSRRNRQMTKLNNLEETIKGAKILFLAGEYIECIEEIIRAYRLSDSCLHGHWGTPPCRYKKEKTGKQQFYDFTYIYSLCDQLSDIKLCLKNTLKNGEQRPFADFYPQGEEDEYYFPNYKE
jgi:hypothetical protein